MKFQKSVDLGGIYFAKVELTLKFDQFYTKNPITKGGLYRTVTGISEKR